MFHTFNSCLDRRLDQIGIPPQVRQALNEQRMKLAAAELPATIDERTRAIVKQAIDECFVTGFRRVMICGAALAFASSLMAWLLIRSR